MARPLGGGVWVVDWEQGRYSLSRVTTRTPVLARRPLAIPEEGAFNAGEFRFLGDGRGRIWVIAGQVFGYVDGRQGSFHRVTLPAAQHVLRRVKDRNLKMTGACIAGDGHLWISRALVQGLLEYAPESGRFTEHPAPATLGVPEAPFALGPEVVVADALRRAPETYRSSYHAIDVKTGKWRRLPKTPGILVAGDGESVVFDELTGDRVVFRDAEGQDRETSLPGVDDVLPPFIGVDGGAVWFRSGDRMVEVETSTALSAAYALPTQEPPAPGTLHGPPGRASIEPTRPVPVTPTDGVIDTDGNLWIAYRYGLAWRVTCFPAP